MSILDSMVPNANQDTLGKKQVPGLLSLNEIIRESLKKAQPGVDKVKLIVRCENLPQIKADRGEMVKLFDDLLGMILNHSPDTTRLLYIDSEEDNSDVIDMTIEEGFKRYLIKFNTNFTTHDNWKLVNSQTFIHCRQILARYNSSLVVNDISSTGCLFSVFLPGKIE